MTALTATGACFANISVIVEGGLVRGVYINGEYVESDVYDFDILDGGDFDEVQDLIDDVRALPAGTDLRHDALSYLGETS